MKNTIGATPKKTALERIGKQKCFEICRFWWEELPVGANHIGLSSIECSRCDGAMRREKNPKIIIVVTFMHPIKAVLPVPAW